MFTSMGVATVLMEGAGAVLLISLTRKGSHIWLGGISASLFSLAASCATGACMEILYLNASGYAGGLDLLVAFGWAIFAVIGFTIATTLASSRWFVAAPCCVVVGASAAYGLVWF